MLNRALIILTALALGLAPITAVTEELLIDDFAGGMSARAEAKLGENPKYRTLKWENMVSRVGEAPIGGSRHYSSLIFEGKSLTVSTERVGRDWFLIHRADPETRGASVMSWDASNNPSSRSPKGLSEFIPPLKHISHLVLEDVTIDIPAPTNEPVILKISLYDVDDPKGNKALVATMLLTSSTVISRIPIATAEFKPEDPEGDDFSGNIAAVTLTVDGGSVKGIHARIGSMRLMGPELHRYITDKGKAAPSDIATAGGGPNATGARMTPVMPADEDDLSVVPALAPEQTEGPVPAADIETPNATVTHTSAPAKTATSEPSATASPTLSPTISPSQTATVTATVTTASAATATPSLTSTATAAPTLTVVPTASFTGTMTETATPTLTATATRKIEAATVAPSPTKAPIPTATAVIPTPTATRTGTASATATRTPTSTATSTATATRSPTKMPKVTPTPKVAAASPTPTITVTPEGTPFYGRCARNLDGKIVCVKFPGQGHSECSMTRDCNTPTPTPSPTITLTPKPTATPAQSCICACRAQSGSRDLVCVEPWVFRIARLGFSCIDQERGTFPWSFERDASAVPAERETTYCQDRWNGKEGAGYPDSSTRAPGVPCVLEQCREGLIRDERR